MFDRMSVKADGPGVYHSTERGQSLRETDLESETREVRGGCGPKTIALVLVVVLVLEKNLRTPGVMRSSPTLLFLSCLTK
jgi:hypothetical protein